MIDLDDYIPLIEIDVYQNNSEDLFDYIEYERAMFEPNGIYIKFTYSNNLF